MENSKAGTPNDCEPRRPRCVNRSGAAGSTSTIFWPIAAPSNCSTFTWRNYSHRSATARRHRAQAAVVPVASARMSCDIRCRLSLAHLAVERGRLAEAAEQLPPIEDLLHRAIECGAMIDPWNILGFGGQFSLFPAVENSVHDHRVDDLLDLMSDILRGVHADSQSGGRRRRRRLATIAHRQPCRAGRLVGQVRGGRDRLDRGHLGPDDAGVGQARGGGVAGVAPSRARRPAIWLFGVATWMNFVRPRPMPWWSKRSWTAATRRRPWRFWCNGSARPKRFRWRKHDHSFHELAMVWMEDLWRSGDRGPRLRRRCPAGCGAAARRALAFCRGSFSTTSKRTPRSIGLCPASRWPPRARKTRSGGESPRLGDEDDLFGAADEDVTYRDSTDDGMESEPFEEGGERHGFRVGGRGRADHRLGCTF